ncbi:hypothetical protein HYH02_013176 [Chlamydomonas schloesseri]|uniref:Uncharacterized protein n=1 Tax=Chlamydomonas schloesseri TaxID=2026947 RepID=A0A835T178_9CHLO|nr:hypothetical protein HYH02_013176 [Chlamydomonas schloesseri]|eukprot:KAG2431959.1 hypothetical protein HYH02_013176 [Chlamydomonas schloesseri]
MLGMEVQSKSTPADVLREARETASKTRAAASQLQMGFTEYCLNKRSEVQTQYGPREAHEPLGWSDSEDSDDVVVEDEDDGEQSSAHACNTRVSANTLHTDAAGSTRDTSPHQLSSVQDLHKAAVGAAARTHSAAYARPALMRTAPEDLLHATATAAAASSSLAAKGVSGGIPSAINGAQQTDQPCRCSSFTSSGRGMSAMPAAAAPPPLSPSAGASMRRRSLHLEFVGETTDEFADAANGPAVIHRRPNRSSIGEDPRAFISAEHTRFRVAGAGAAAGGDGAAPMWVQRAAGLVSDTPASAMVAAAAAGIPSGEAGSGGGGGRFTRGRLLHLMTNNAGPAAVVAAAAGIMPPADSDDDGYAAAAAAAGVLAAPPPAFGKAASFRSTSMRRRSIDIVTSPSGGSPAVAQSSPSGGSFTTGGAPLRPTHLASPSSSGRTGSARPAAHGFGAVSPPGAAASAAAAARAFVSTPVAAPAPGSGGATLQSRPVVCRTQSSIARCGPQVAAPSWEEPPCSPRGGAGGVADAAGDAQARMRSLLLMQNRHPSMRQREGPVVSAGAGAAASGGMPEWRAAAAGSAASVAATAGMHQPRPPAQPSQHRSFRRGSMDEQWLALQRGGLFGAAAAAAGATAATALAGAGAGHGTAAPPPGVWDTPARGVAAAGSASATSAASAAGAAAAVVRGLYMAGRGSVDHADIRPVVPISEESSELSHQASSGLDGDRFGEGSVMARLFEKWKSLRRSNATLHD